MKILSNIKQFLKGKEKSEYDKKQWIFGYYFDDLWFCYDEKSTERQTFVDAISNCVEVILKMDESFRKQFQMEKCKIFKVDKNFNVIQTIPIKEAMRIHKLNRL
jgi:hypothetical protein